MEESNHDRGTFEGRVESDLEWIKDIMVDLQTRLRNIEKDMIRVKAVGGFLGLLGGFLASLGLRVWGK